MQRDNVLKFSGKNDGFECHASTTFGAFDRIVSECFSNHASPCCIDFLGCLSCFLQKMIDEREVFSSNSVGQETIIPDITKVSIWYVGDKVSDKDQGGQRHGFCLLGIMVEVFISYRYSIVVGDSCLTYRRALEISSEIFHIFFEVIGLLFKVNIPCFLVELIQPGVKGIVVFNVSKIRSQF